MSAMDDMSHRRERLECCPPEHADYYFALSDLAFGLYDRFEKKRQIDDLNEAITCYRDALELRPVEDENGDRSNSLNHLGYCLGHRYRELGTVDDLEEAITIGREALALSPPGQPRRDVSLHNLGYSLLARFEAQAEVCDLEEAIQLLRAALELRPHGHWWRSSTLHQLILCLSSRYESQGLVADLEELVTLRRAELDLYPRGHSDHVASLHNLACDLRRRYAKIAAITDLEESIELNRVALELRTPQDLDRFSTLRELALCLSTRYDKLGIVSDLEEAIESGRAALKLLTRRHPSCGESLHHLASNLRKRFVKQAAMRDLEEAIELLRPALEVRPVGHPERPSSLYELAFCLSHRHDKYRVAEDLDEAVTLGREALKLCPPRHPDRGLLLNSLAYDLWKKFQYLRQAAVVVCPSSSADLASALFELSQRLWDRFQKQAMLIDLDDAIYLATYALELRSPEDDSVAAWVERLLKGENLYSPAVLDEAIDGLRALANYYRARFQSQHEMVDLNEAITYYRHALRFQLTGRPSRASFLHDLAQCLVDRFRQCTTTADLDDAIALEQEALHLLDREDPEYDASRRCLIHCLKTKFSSQVDVTSSDVSSVIHLDVEQVIRDIVFETLKNMPTRLLHTPTGILCNRDEQVSRFMKSKLYKRLVSRCATCDWHQQMDRIRADISRDFQYVTLSHRWGEGEPSLRDIEGHTIYGMSIRGGFGKLQTFCRVALEWNYLWAWIVLCWARPEALSRAGPGPPRPSRAEPWGRPVGAQGSA
ncbi:hypothetical protein EDD15DRAFT_2441273 [Pisolithus albus]|nr:hypothetical protein EDD15DRAFT_2441273 [Pisolithus albus]